MFLQKLLTNFQATKTLPLGNVLPNSKFDYYGPFLFDDKAKSYDLVSPLHEKPFGSFFPPSHSDLLDEKNAESLINEINQILSQYLKSCVTVANIRHHCSDHFIEFNQLEKKPISANTWIKTPFGDYILLTRDDHKYHNHDIVLLARLKNEIRFICEDSFQHIQKIYEQFIQLFQLEVVANTEMIQFECGIFSCSLDYQSKLAEAGVKVETVSNQLRWKFPLCLNSEDENTLLKIFKSVFNINEAICLS